MNQELNEYIKNAKGAGKNDEQIREELLKSGWSVENVDALLKPTETTEIATKNYHYYITRAISVAVLLYAAVLLFMSSFLIYAIPYLGKNAPLTLQLVELLKVGFGLAVLVAIFSLVGVIGSLGLFFFKRWGLYFTYTYILFVWFFSLGITLEDVITLLVATAILIYLILKRKSILGFKKT